MCQIIWTYFYIYVAVLATYLHAYMNNQYMILVPNLPHRMSLKKHELKLANICFVNKVFKVYHYIIYMCTIIKILPHKFTFIINKFDLNETRTSVICLRLGDGGLGWWRLDSEANILAAGDVDPTLWTYSCSIVVILLGEGCVSKNPCFRIDGSPLRSPSLR